MYILCVYILIFPNLRAHSIPPGMDPVSVCIQPGLV